MKEAFKLSLSILFALVIGAIGGFYTSSNITSWYVTLNKPTFNPPNYLFAPVWTTLYILMGISFYKVLSKATTEKLRLKIIYITQITLNFLWSIIFFKFHEIGAAAFEIVLLWLSILVMILIFYKTNKWTAYLNIPYLLWVSFASILNFSIYFLNS